MKRNVREEKPEEPSAKGTTHADGDPKPAAPQRLPFHFVINYMRHSLLAQELSLRLAAPVRCPGKTKLDRAEAFLCVYNAITGNADRDVDVDVDWGWGWEWEMGRDKSGRCPFVCVNKCCRAARDGGQNYETLVIRYHCLYASAALCLLPTFRSGMGHSSCLLCLGHRFLPRTVWNGTERIGTSVTLMSTARTRFRKIGEVGSSVHHMSHGLAPAASFSSSSSTTAPLIAGASSSSCKRCKKWMACHRCWWLPLGGYNLQLHDCRYRTAAPYVGSSSFSSYCRSPARNRGFGIGNGESEMRNRNPRQLGKWCICRPSDRSCPALRLCPIVPDRKFVECALKCFALPRTSLVPPLPPNNNTLNEDCFAGQMDLSIIPLIRHVFSDQVSPYH